MNLRLVVCEVCQSGAVESKLLRRRYRPKFGSSIAPARVVDFS